MLYCRTSTNIGAHSQWLQAALELWDSFAKQPTGTLTSIQITSWRLFTIRWPLPVPCSSRHRRTSISWGHDWMGCILQQLVFHDSTGCL